MKVDSSIDFKWKKTKVHFGVIGIAMLFSLSLLAQDNRFFELNHKLMKLERERRNLDEERDMLSLDVERQKNPGRIRSLAVTELGMVTPALTSVHELSSNTP